MREAVKRLWPEIDWIQDAQLREQVTEAWTKALERSSLTPDDYIRSVHAVDPELPYHVHGT